MSLAFNYTLGTFMKKTPNHYRTIFFLTISIMLVFLNTAFGFSSVPSQSVTATPIPSKAEIDITLEVGSTDGILIWAVLITIIIITPVLWKLLLTGRMNEEQKNS